MTDQKPTMYEILEVSPNALFPEIKAAHKLLSRALISEKLGLRREEIDLKLQVIDLAFNTLSDPAARDAYDAQLATQISPANIALPHNPNALSLRPDTTALRIAAAIEDSHKIAAAIGGSHESPLKIVSTTIDSSVKSLKKILGIIAFLIVLGTVIKVASMDRQTEHATGELSKAEEKVFLQEYYQTHGVRVGSKAEADLLEVENRRKENEQRAATLEVQKKDEEYSRFEEESRRIGDQVSENLRRDEERARYEEEQRKQQLVQAKREKEEAEQEAERIRIENERRKMGLN